MSFFNAVDWVIDKGKSAVKAVDPYLKWVPYKDEISELPLLWDIEVAGELAYDGYNAFKDWWKGTPDVLGDKSGSQFASLGNKLPKDQEGTSSSSTITGVPPPKPADEEDWEPALKRVKM